MGEFVWGCGWARVEGKECKRGVRDRGEDRYLVGVTEVRKQMKVAVANAVLVAFGHGHGHGLGRGGEGWWGWRLAW